MACLKCNTDFPEECRCDGRPKLISVDAEDVLFLTEARDILFQHTKDNPHIEVYGILSIDRILKDYGDAAK